MGPAVSRREADTSLPLVGNDDGTGVLLRILVRR